MELFAGFRDLLIATGSLRELQKALRVDPGDGVDGRVGRVGGHEAGFHRDGLGPSGIDRKAGSDPGGVEFADAFLDESGLIGRVDLSLQDLGGDRGGQFGSLVVNLRDR